jgi:transcriptional regulator with XRE-family HTH domain
MPARVDRRGDGRRRGERLVRMLGSEWQHARVAAGLAQRHVAAAVGASRSRISRIERGEVRGLTIVRAAEISAVLGMDLTVRQFPAGPPLRDAGHIALLARFDGVVSPPYRITREAPMPIAGDRRAWDRRLDGPACIGVEAETRVADLQDLEREIALKVRDSGVNRAILLLARSRHNRELLRAELPSLRQSFPLGTREVLAALRAGRDPGANGLIVL